MPKNTILIAPLNWGLGHATRCIPLIHELQRQGATVILASDGAALDLLRREFPDLESHALPPYNIRYPFRSMVLSIALQFPKLLRGCLGEYFWLRRFLKNRRVDAVISDNRFGFFSRHVPSVFMTHQVQILVPLPFLQGFANVANRFFIRRFDACWVPDFADFDKNLSGKLGHSMAFENVSDTSKVSDTWNQQRHNNLAINYLGALSRLKNTPSVKRYKIAFVLSGPEPQRDFFEAKIWENIQNFYKKTDNQNTQILLVRGTAAPMKTHLDDLIFDKNKDFKKWKNVEIHDVLTSQELNQKMLESEVIICRSGYSSLMDLWALQLPAILIPTDGQTEQEYLADKLMSENRFFSQRQSSFDLETALAAYPNYTGFKDFPTKNETLPNIVREFLIL